MVAHGFADDGATDDLHQCRKCHRPEFFCSRLALATAPTTRPSFSQLVGLVLGEASRPRPMARRNTVWALQAPGPDTCIVARRSRSLGFLIDSMLLDDVLALFKQGFHLPASCKTQARQVVWRDSIIHDVPSYSPLAASPRWHLTSRAVDSDAPRCIRPRSLTVCGGEFYMAYADYNDLMDMTEDSFRSRASPSA